MIGTKIVKGFREIKVTNSGQTKDCIQATPYGFDSRPLRGGKAILGMSDKYSVIMGYIQSAVEDLDEGDSIMFSKDSSGNIVTKIIAKGDGKINITSDDTIDINNGNLTIEP